MTADSAGAAAVQLLVWIGLLAISIFAATIDPRPEWWLAIGAWTLGLAASAATIALTSPAIDRWLRAPRPEPTIAGGLARAMAVVVLGSLSLLALAVAISTGSSVALVLLVLSTAVCILTAVVHRP